MRGLEDFHQKENSPFIVIEFVRVDPLKNGVRNFIASVEVNLGFITE